MAGISMWQLLIILAIVMLLFGTKRLRGAGKDLAALRRDFSAAVEDKSKQ